MTQSILETHPTQARISLSAFRHNLGIVKSSIGSDVGVMAVVKADAYGHGVLPIAREAIACGVSHLAVARVDEGLELRSAAITEPILVFESPTPAQLHSALTNELQLTVVSLSSAELINTAAAALRRVASVHCKVDTGMGRLGMPDSEAIEVIKQVHQLQHVRIEGVYSHFASSDEENLSYAREQLTKFRSVVDGLQTAGLKIPHYHMANSGAIIAFPESHFNLVRPGIMLYGYHPRKGGEVRGELMPVMSLVSRISQLKTVPPGTSISYNSRYRTPQQTRIATVPIGYADGYSRALTNMGEVLIRGDRYPVVGTICMDHIMVDVGTSGEIETGDEVVLIGESGDERIDAWDLAAKINTIPYEITCNVSRRVPRIVVE